MAGPFDPTASPYVNTRPTVAQQPTFGGPASLSASLPWQNLQSQANAFAGLGSDPQAALAGLGQSYAGNYNAALGLNADLFSKTQTGYENLRGQLDQQYQDISQGYSDVYGDVLGRIAGTNSSNIQDINTQYNAAAGSSMQGAINRGLGNSTVQQNMQRGIELDRARAITGSQNQFAQLGANYASQIGQNRLQSQQQGAQTQAGLGSQQLNFLGSTSIPYPDARMYTQLAQMYGGNLEAQRNREAFDQAQRPGIGFSAMAGGVGGASSGGTPFSGPRMGGSGGFGSFGGYGSVSQGSGGSMQFPMGSAYDTGYGGGYGGENPSAGYEGGEDMSGYGSDQGGYYGYGGDYYSGGE